MIATPTSALTRLLLVAGWAVIAMQYARAEIDAPEISTLSERIELAFQARDVDGIENARQELLAVAARRHSPRAAYYAAYARFRQALVAAADGNTHSRQAGSYIDQCITELGSYVDVHPADAEARALLGSCLGISTRYHRLAMASRGLAARRHMAAARALAPQNPWVMLQDGLADFATPRLFGGNRHLAIAKLETATTLFAAAIESGSRLATWGAAEAWLQLAEMYRETGRAADARFALQQASSLAPRPPDGLAQLAAL